MGKTKWYSTSEWSDNAAFETGKNRSKTQKSKPSDSKPVSYTSNELSGKQVCFHQNKQPVRLLLAQTRVRLARFIIAARFQANRYTYGIFAQKTIKERLAFFLITLNEKYKTPDQINGEAEIKVNRSDLASYTGTSLENLVRTLREFRDKNLIRTTGKSIYITDIDALFSLTGMQVSV